MTQYTDYLYDVSYNDPIPSGVYAIVNVRLGKVYVGSTTNFSYRSAQHFKALEEGIHHNRNLQYSFDTTGAAGFSFIILERVPDVGRLADAEQSWLNRLKSIAYNVQRKIERPEWKDFRPVDDVVLPWEEELPDASS